MLTKLFVVLDSLNLYGMDVTSSIKPVKNKK